MTPEETTLEEMAPETALEETAPETVEMEGQEEDDSDLEEG